MEDKIYFTANTNPENGVVKANIEANINGSVYSAEYECTSLVKADEIMTAKLKEIIFESCVPEPMKKNLAYKGVVAAIVQNEYNIRASKIIRNFHYIINIKKGD
jgi:hypothetical protein